MPPQDPIDIIATQILLDARSALDSLREFNKQTEASGKKIQALEKLVANVANRLGGDFDKAEAAIKRFSGELTKIHKEEIKFARLMAEGKAKQYADYQKRQNVEQGKVAAAGLKISDQLLAKQQALNAARERENALIEQAGAKLARQLKVKQRASDEKALQKRLEEERKIREEEERLIKAREKENALVDQAGQKLANQLRVQRQLAEQKEAEKARLPQNFIPNYVQKQFGDINAYIAQSANKVEAWKRVVVSSARAAGVSFERAGLELKKMVSGTSVRDLEQALKQLGGTAQGSFQKIFTSVNAARIALGAFVSMLFFQATQAVTTFVSDAVKQFTELEESLFRIRAAEKALSEAGLEVSVAGLKSGIQELREELRVFSSEELTKLVGQVAVMTKELGFSEQQILDFARAIAIKNIVSVEEESLSQTANKLITPLLTATSKGAASLGIAFDETTISAKALEMGVLKAGESFKDLTENEKDLVKLQLILDSAAGDAALFGDFLDSNSAKIRENAASVEDLKASLGGLLASVVPVLTPLVDALNSAVNGFKALIPVFQTIITTGKSLEVAIAIPGNRIEAVVKTLKSIPDTFRQIASESIPRLFAEIPADAPEWFKNLYGEFLQDTETATSEVKELLQLDDDELAKTLEEIDDKLRDIAIDAQHAKEDLEVALSQKQEDLEIKFTQKRADIDTEYVRKEEDAARDLQRRIDDINRDAARDKEKILEKAREDERKAEEDHQLKLWELKMRYLMDLEDALHARDARQIIRLQREYELEKELLEKKKNQDDEERARSLEADLEDAEAKRQERLQEAQIEYEQKLADLAEAKARELEELNLWKAREEADLKLWYQRELEEIDRNTRQKIEKLLAGYIEEQKIHEEQQEAIHQILLKYFGKNTDLVDGLMQYTNQAFANMAALAQSAFAFAGAAPGVSAPLSYDQLVQNQGGGGGGGKRYAQGGTLIATKPTTATFGEVPELVTFTPLNRRGRDVGKIFTSGDLSGGEGRIELDILLSPDLEARIIEESMDGVADVVARVNRAKV